MTARQSVRGRWVPLAAVTAAVASACLGVVATGETGPRLHHVAVKPVAESVPSGGLAPLAVVPADGTTAMRTDQPVSVSVASGRLGDVRLSDPAGRLVAGTLDAGGTQWTSAGRLRTHTRYTLAATSVDEHGLTATRTSAFTTFTPGDALKLDLAEPVDTDTVGVGMPVMLQFTTAVGDRAAVEKALRVVSDPPQAGHWAWLSDYRVDYRPQSYWRPGTRVRVMMELDGVQAGGGRYGTADQTVGFTVGRAQESVVDTANHSLTVYRDGREIKNLPVTSGRPGMDTWGGTLAVIDKSPSVHMTSRSIGLGDEYDLPDVRWAVHLTYSGTFTHAAPWSVGSQGYANVSHGCVGMSDENAYWFYQNTLPGDVVKITNSPRQAAPGNGYGDWQLGWDQWLTHSAVKS